MQYQILLLILHWINKRVNDMNEIKKTINGFEVTFNVAQTDTYNQVVAVCKGSIIYSVIENVSDNINDVIDDVCHVLLNKLN